MGIHVHDRIGARAERLSFRGLRSLRRAAVAALGAWLVATPAWALGVDVPDRTPSIVGQESVFTAVVTDAVGDVRFEWRFGDGSFVEGGAQMTHVFDAPGHHPVDVAAIDAEGNAASAFFLHLAHHPLTEARPTASAPIVFDPARNRIYSVNQDNGTVAVIDPDGLALLAEIEVYRGPESLTMAADGTLWVVHRDDYAVAVIDADQLVVTRGFRLPYASQPIAIVTSPAADAVYVSLMAVGKLLRLNPTTGDVVGEAEVGGRPRGIAVSHDGAYVYVTRFLSTDEAGEVVKVDSATMSVAARIGLPLDADTEDSDLQARGVPNYLFGVGLTPDGRQGWVPGKKDNIVRGLLRDGQVLTHDTSVRPLASILDVQANTEILESRIDLDDRSMPVHVEFTPYGDFAILTLAGSNRIEVRDVARPTQVFSAIADAGLFPRGSVLTPSGRLFVQGSLSRSVLAYDMTALLESFDPGTPPLLAEISTAQSETLAADVLLGKRLFHDATDTRMAFEGYLSCGGCHFEGLDDGRVWDFTDRGEGLRNTSALIGRKGIAHGPLNWTGTFDEIQDFEHLIRDFFDGTGFLPDEVLAEGTRGEPLGDPKAGLSPELDALAAYVTSLEHVNPSPYRNADGTLTDAGVAGKGIFERLGCDFCHGGVELTDSGTRSMPDVGTLTTESGSRAGERLFGIDTPTLLGVWETPPYLHDGSAPTLRDVLTTRNPDDLHGFVSSLSSDEVDQLVAYLLQIDDEAGVRRLPFEPPLPEVDPSAGGMGAGGTAGGEAGTSSAGDPVAAGEGSGGTNAGGAPAAGSGHLDVAGMSVGGSGCAVAAGSRRSVPLDVLGGLALGVWLARRRRRAFGRDAA